jgi:PAS domain S-box-containing protein
MNAELFHAIVEHAPDAIIFADRGGAIRAWNRRAEAIFGHAAAEVMGGRLDVIIPERFRAAHDAGFRKAIATAATKYAGRVLTTRALHKDGRKLYVDLSFSILVDDAGLAIGAIAIGRDVTDRLSARQPEMR